MKKFSILLIGILAISALLTGCVQDSNNFSDDLSHIEPLPILATEKDSEIFEYKLVISGTVTDINLKSELFTMSVESVTPINAQNIAPENFQIQEGQELILPITKDFMHPKTGKLNLSLRYIKFINTYDQDNQFIAISAIYNESNYEYIQFTGTILYKNGDPWIDTEDDEFYLEIDRSVRIHEELMKRLSVDPEKTEKSSDGIYGYYRKAPDPRDYIKEGENVQIKGRLYESIGVYGVEAIRLLSETQLKEIKEQKKLFRIDEPKANAVISNETALLIRGVAPEFITKGSPHSAGLTATLFNEDNKLISSGGMSQYDYANNSFVAEIPFRSVSKAKKGKLVIKIHERNDPNFLDIALEKITIPVLLQQNSLPEDTGESCIKSGCNDQFCSYRKLSKCQYGSQAYGPTYLHESDLCVRRENGECNWPELRD